MITITCEVLGVDIDPPVCACGQPGEDQSPCVKKLKMSVRLHDSCRSTCEHDNWRDDLEIIIRWLCLLLVPEVLTLVYMVYRLIISAFGVAAASITPSVRSDRTPLQKLPTVEAAPALSVLLLPEPLLVP